MRTLLWFVLGYGLAIAAGLCALSAGGLVAVGLAARLFLRREPGMVDVFNFDPNNLMLRATLPAAAAVGFAILIFIVAKRLPKRLEVKRGGS